jgi:hypothetical protein
LGKIAIASHKLEKMIVEAIIDKWLKELIKSQTSAVYI